MEKVAFLFCVHNHQPVGNFTHILENAFETAYRIRGSILEQTVFGLRVQSPFAWLRRQG